MGGREPGAQEGSCFRAVGPDALESQHPESQPCPPPQVCCVTWDSVFSCINEGGRDEMLTKATRIQILGLTTSLLGAWRRGDDPTPSCTADLTGLPGANQERVVRG